MIYLKLLKLKGLSWEFCQTKRTKRSIWPRKNKIISDFPKSPHSCMPKK